MASTSAVSSLQYAWSSSHSVTHTVDDCDSNGWTRWAGRHLGGSTRHHHTWGRGVHTRQHLRAAGVVKPVVRIASRWFCYMDTWIHGQHMFLDNVEMRGSKEEECGRSLDKTWAKSEEMMYVSAEKSAQW